MSNQYVFLYRKDIYEQLGLTPPATMDEYFAQAEVLKQNGYFAGAFDPLTGPTDYFLDFMYMLGGHELNDDGSISMDKAAEALELMKKGYDAGIWHKSSQGSGEAYWTAFNNGEIAAFPAPAYQAAYYETNVDPAGKGGFGKLGIAPAMRFTPDGPATYIRNTEYFAINKNTKYPNAAKMVLKYLCQSTEAAVAFSSVNEDLSLLTRTISPLYRTSWSFFCCADTTTESPRTNATRRHNPIMRFMRTFLLSNILNTAIPNLYHQTSRAVSILSQPFGDRAGPRTTSSSVIVGAAGGVHARIRLLPDLCRR
jgi:hypothetical protein